MGLFKNRVKKPKSKARKIIEWVFTILFAAIFLFFAVMNIVAQTSKGKNHGVPNYAGYQVLVVQTDSMEPKYKINTAVFVKKVDPSTFKAGDDITFMWDVFHTGQLIPMTHQLTSVETFIGTDNQTHYQFTAHGINKESRQCAGDPKGSATADCTNQYQTFNESVVLGKVIGKSVIIGHAFDFMTKPIGLLVLLLVPALFLIITSVIDIVKAGKSDDEPIKEGADVIDGDNPPEKENKLDGLSKEEKERLKKELLNQMLEEKMKGAKKDE